MKDLTPSTTETYKMSRNDCYLVASWHFVILRVENSGARTVIVIADAKAGISTAPGG